VIEIDELEDEEIFWISLTMVSPDNCSVTDSILIHVNNCFGLSEIAKRDISIYPNPAGSHIAISSNLFISLTTLKNALNNQRRLKMYPSNAIRYR